MATRDAFAGKFRQMLDEIPDDYTLPQWQFIYQQAIISMGLRILGKFEQKAIGPDPFETHHRVSARSTGSDRQQMGGDCSDSSGQQMGGDPPIGGGGQGGGGNSTGAGNQTAGGGQGIGGLPCLVLANLVIRLPVYDPTKRP